MQRAWLRLWPSPYAAASPTAHWRPALQHCLLLCALLLAAIPASAQIRFPELTGRVVDNADLLSAATEIELTQLLAEHEAATTNQVVVATLEDLQGYSIEDFGYQLGRAWGIGQAERDNGALLLVAKSERQVRIEVGYGLEGALTDALAADIIRRVILPAFKLGQFDVGINEGTRALLQAIAGEYQAAPRRSAREEAEVSPLLVLLFVIGLIVLPIIIGASSGRPPGGSGMSPLLWAALGAGMSRRGGGGFGGGGFGGGGFGGGGGGFGGGGGSGGW